MDVAHSEPQSQPDRSWLRDLCLLLPFISLLILYLWTGAPTITTAFGSADSGELATAVALGGVPHPPGYPTYLLLGRVALLLPWGEVAARLVGLNALAVALAASVLAATIRDLPIGTDAQRTGAGMVAALLFGLDRRVWEQALVVEVYALALLFAALLLWLAARWWRWHNQRTAAAAGLVLGLGLGIQVPIMAWVMGAALAWLVVRRLPSVRAVLLFSGALLLGLSVYALLLWRGAAVPLASWGDWQTPRGAIGHITAREYGYLVDAVPWNIRLGRISYAVRDLVAGMGWAGVMLTVGGLVGAGTVLRRWRWLSGGMAAATVAWAISYGGADGSVYLLPLHLLAGLWSGVGAVVGLQWLALHQPKLVRWTALVPVLLVVFGVRNAPRISLHDTTTTRDQAQIQLETAPANAILISSDDATTFPLWYVGQVLGVRPDVTVVDARLWANAWYRRRLPCAAGADVAALRECGRPVVPVRE